MVFHHSHIRRRPIRFHFDSLECIMHGLHASRYKAYAVLCLPTMPLPEGKRHESIIIIIIFLILIYFFDNSYEIGKGSM